MDSDQILCLKEVVLGETSSFFRLSSAKIISLKLRKIVYMNGGQLVVKEPMSDDNRKVGEILGSKVL